jgi:putative redox protein
MAKPQVHVDLTWTGDLTFRAETHGGRHLVTDGNSHAGFSPVELLAASAATCMAVDVVHILTRSRSRPAAVRVSCTGDRAESDPHRLLRLMLAFEIDGTVPQAQVDRALALSREKYCSVWHSLRPDIQLELSVQINATAGT